MTSNRAKRAKPMDNLQEIAVGPGWKTIWDDGSPAADALKAEGLVCKFMKFQFLWKGRNIICQRCHGNRSSCRRIISFHGNRFRAHACRACWVIAGVNADQICEPVDFELAVPDNGGGPPPAEPAISATAPAPPPDSPDGDQQSERAHSPPGADGLNGGEPSMPAPSSPTLDDLNGGEPSVQKPSPTPDGGEPSMPAPFSGPTQATSNQRGVPAPPPTLNGARKHRQSSSPCLNRPTRPPLRPRQKRGLTLKSKSVKFQDAPGPSNAPGPSQTTPSSTSAITAPATPATPKPPVTPVAGSSRAIGTPNGGQALGGGYRQAIERIAESEAAVEAKINTLEEIHGAFSAQLAAQRELLDAQQERADRILRDALAADPLNPFVLPPPPAPPSPIPPSFAIEDVEEAAEEVGKAQAEVAKNLNFR